MTTDKNAGARLSKLQDSLDTLTEKLGSAGERIREEVGTGVERAIGWTQFAHAVAPVVEAAPDQTMAAQDIARALDDESDTSAPVMVARERRDAFIASHGADAWQQHIDDAGTLRIDRGAGRLSVTRVSR